MRTYYIVLYYYYKRTTVEVDCIARHEDTVSCALMGCTLSVMPW